MPTYTEVLSRLKKGEASGIYLFYGTEPYFMQQLKQHMKQAVIGQDDEANLSTYSLEDTPIQDVIADAETYPFFGERKLIFAGDPVFLQSKSKKLPFDHDMAALEAYAKSPAPYSVLVLMANYEKIDKRKKISKVLHQHAIVVSCEPIKSGEIKKWLHHMAGINGVTIDEPALELLETGLSTNLYMMQNELAKLRSYAGSSITKEAVENLMAESVEQTSLQLVETVIKGDLAQAISIHKQLLNMKEDPIAFVALFAYQFRVILQIKRLKQKGYAQGQLQQYLNVHPYVIKLNSQRESHFSAEQLEAILIRLAKTDAVLKQGRMESQLASELMLYDIIQIKYPKT